MAHAMQEHRFAQIAVCIHVDMNTSSNKNDPNEGGGLLLDLVRAAKVSIILLKIYL